MVCCWLRFKLTMSPRFSFSFLRFTTSASRLLISSCDKSSQFYSIMGSLGRKLSLDTETLHLGSIPTRLLGEARDSGIESIKKAFLNGRVNE